MIRFTSESGRPVCEAFATGRYSVYLDNDSLITLAKTPNPEMRERFVAAIKNGGNLLFSLANAVEISGPQENSAEAVRSFLDSIGPHWVPLELNPMTERSGERKARQDERDGLPGPSPDGHDRARRQERIQRLADPDGRPEAGFPRQPVVGVRLTEIQRVHRAQRRLRGTRTAAA